MTRSTPTEQLPAGIVTSLKVTSTVVVIAGVVALVTLGMPWIDERYIWSLGPPLSLGVFVLAMVGASLIGNHGPRVRWSDRAAYRQRVAAGRAQGMSARKAAIAARDPYAGRVRAGRAIGGGIAVALAGWLEAYLVSTNLHTMDIRGYTPGVGPEVATVVAWVLLVTAAVVLALGVIGLFVPLVAGAEATGGGEMPTPGVVAAAPPAGPPVWTPTHHVPVQGLPAYDAPVGGAPSVMLDPLLPVVVTAHQDGWAHVRAVNGWEGWVDAAQLVSALPEPPATRAPVPQIPPMPVG